ncbi:MAG: pirin family protein [Aliidiomarina sp.]|uniref:pirin family protein n=1 Tax=Aliidiomarina sp. TaxID=1872439 RepID=UPI0025C0F82D|nr:pirin family protein [Aliidiomarina sp.]MCH8502599.1 pirin family protein [Aliidiomarina sp.]
MSRESAANTEYTSEGKPCQTKRIQARMSDVGGIPVARTLPTKAQRTIGPWCFLDHAGPVTFSADETGMQVGPHPHTCLQTFTWMLAGEVLHRDSLGNRQIIRPSQVNLMTAGHGISHTEESVFSKESGRELHAAQLWIAMPESEQNSAPAFEHYSDLPIMHLGHVALTLLIGEFNGQKAPTRTYLPIVGIDLHFAADDEISVNLEPAFEYGITALVGGFSLTGTTFNQDELAVLATGHDTATISAKKGSRLLLIGGTPLTKPITIWWNYVGYSKEYISQAQQDWHAHHKRFGDVPNSNAARMQGPEVPWR